MSTWQIITIVFGMWPIIALVTGMQIGKFLKENDAESDRQVKETNLTY